MRYVLMIYENEADRAGLSQEALGAEYMAYNAFSEDLFTWDNDIENDEANINPCN